MKLDPIDKTYQTNEEAKVLLDKFLISSGKPRSNAETNFALNSSPGAIRIIRIAAHWAQRYGLGWPDGATEIWSETYMKVISGERKIPMNVNLFSALYNIMGSVADNSANKHRREQLDHVGSIREIIENPETVGHAGFPDPEKAAIAKIDFETISLFLQSIEDPAEKYLAAGYMSGHLHSNSPMAEIEDYMENQNLNIQAASVRRRLRRRLEKMFPEWTSKNTTRGASNA